MFASLSFSILVWAGSVSTVSSTLSPDLHIPLLALCFSKPVLSCGPFVLGHCGPFPALGPSAAWLLRCSFSTSPMLLLFATVPGCRVMDPFLEGVSEALVVESCSRKTNSSPNHMCTFNAPYTEPQCPWDMACSPDILFLQPATSLLSSIWWTHIVPSAPSSQSPAP